VTSTEVVVRLFQPPAVYSSVPPPANYLRFRISPEVSIALGTMVLKPGEAMEGTPAELLASHHPGGEEMDAYERLLGDAMRGDATQFAREDYVEEAWRIVEPILGTTTPVYEYQPGTWGPVEADRIAPAAGWRIPAAPGMEQTR
jgi:glucose-6-phosphate 1-dehydrogenase